MTMPTSRRSFLKRFGSAISLGSFLSQATTPNNQTNDGWTMYQYDARNTGQNPNAPGPLSGVRQRWKVNTETSIYDSPAITGNSVYFLTSGGMLYALDKNTGEGRWSIQLDDDYDGSYSNYSSPAVSDDTIFVGSGDQRLYAVGTSGKIKWKKGTGGGIFSSPTVDRNSVFIGSEDGKLYSLNTQSGAKDWDFDTGSRIIATPAVSDNRVFIGCAESPYQEDNFFAVDRGSGEERWSFIAEGQINTSAAVSSNSVFVGDQSGYIYSIDKRSGGVNWKTNLGDSLSSSLVLTDEFVGAISGSTVYTLNKSDGSEVWNFTLTDDYSSGRDIAASNRAVYVGDVDGTVRGLQNGIEEWRYEGAEGSFYGVPAIVGKTVYVGDTSGSLYSVSDSTTRTKPPPATDSQPSSTTPPSSKSSTIIDTKTDPTSSSLLTQTDMKGRDAGRSSPSQQVATTISAQNSGSSGSSSFILAFLQTTLGLVLTILSIIGALLGIFLKWSKINDDR